MGGWPNTPAQALRVSYLSIIFYQYLSAEGCAHNKIHPQPICIYSRLYLQWPPCLKQCSNWGKSYTCWVKYNSTNSWVKCLIQPLGQNTQSLGSFIFYPALGCIYPSIFLWGSLFWRGYVLLCIYIYNCIFFVIYIYIYIYIYSTCRDEIFK